MKKLLSIILTVAMLATMLTAFSVFVSADVVEGPSLEAQYRANDMADAYSIYTAADYVYFFNNRGDFYACEIKIENDIDLNPGWTAQRVVTTNTTPAQPGADGEMGTADDVPETTTTTYSVDQTGLTTKLSISYQVWFKGADADHPAVFNGQGHTIKGVYVEGIGGSEGSALLGRVQNAVIKNVRFENCATISYKPDGSGDLGQRVGGIVTIASGTTTFENVYADILVTGSSQVGGFVALNMNNDTTSVTYNNCVSVCDVLGTGTAVGGFVGDSWDRSASTFTNCGFYGKVEAVESAGGSDPRAVGMFVGKTSAGTFTAAAKAMLNSRVTLNNCIGAGEVVCNKEWNGALVGYTFFHSKAVIDATTGEITGYTSNINEANSSGKTQYINLSLTNCIYAGDYTKAVGDNKDFANILGTAATFNCDAQYNLTQTAVVKVEANTLTGANATLKVDGFFDLTEDWITDPNGVPLPKVLAKVLDLIAPYVNPDTNMWEVYNHDKNIWESTGEQYVADNPAYRVNSETNTWERSDDHGLTWKNTKKEYVSENPAYRREGWELCVSTDHGLTWSKTGIRYEEECPAYRVNTETNMWEKSDNHGLTWENTGIEYVEKYPAYRVNTETNIWEKSNDHGLTWENTGKKYVQENPAYRADENAGRWEVSYDHGLTWSFSGIYYVETPAYRANTTDKVLEVSHDHGLTWETADIEYVENNPALRVNEDTNEWEITYDHGLTWESLGVKATGDKGDKGDTGAQGEKGDKGDTGATGATGAAGADGKDGITPTLRINSTTNEWEVSYDNGQTWTSLGVKATGDKGDKGDQGEQGIQGEKGDKGDTGAQGEKGDKGDTGAQGEKGDKGDTGAQGEKGDKGDTGAQGEKGDKGDTGATGATGAQGEKGDKGDQGEQGIQGEKGDKGDKGDTGATGATGAAGADGKDGITPVLRVNPTSNEWEVSYDGGQSWSSLGVKATGDKGDQGEKGDSATVEVRGCAGSIGLAGIALVAAVATVGVVLKKKED